MMQISDSQARSVAAAVALLAVALLAGRAVAAHVDGVYAESVPVADASPEAARAAFAEALRRVLVKATGQGAAGRDPALIARFGDPSALVQQFRRDASGNLWAQFDPAAVRRGLEAAGLPVWGDDRPVTVAWLAFDSGAGERDVLSSGGLDGPTTAALRRDLLNSAASRAVPLVLPLRDSQDLAAVSYADVWGDFVEPVVKASARYQADAVLIGRARLFPAGMIDVRWTLLVGGERLEWRGGVADGPQGLADRLAQRLASSGIGGLGATRLTVSGIATMDQYGLLLGYLQGLDVIESLSVGRIAGNTMDFDLRLRGDRERLVRALAVRRVVEPALDPPTEQAALAAGAGEAVLRYRLGTGR